MITRWLPRLVGMIDDGESFEPMPPGERVLKTRRGARIALRCGARMLVVSDSDPGVPGSSWWVLPGGGVDEGESWRQAACRELAEETGLVVSEADLIGPLAHRVVHHGYSNKVLVQEEFFFAVDLPAPFEPDRSGFTPREQQTLGDFGWFGFDELAAMTLWPPEAALLLGADPDVLLEWGEMEESTVAVSLGYRRS